MRCPGQINTDGIDVISIGPDGTRGHGRRHQGPGVVTARPKYATPAPVVHADAGMTLIEVMVVLVLVALMVGSAVAGIRSMAKSDLRASASQDGGRRPLSFRPRLDHGQGSSLGVGHRQGRYWAEVTDDRFVMAGGRETEESRKREADKLAKEAEEAAKRADEKAGLEEMQARYKPEPFRPKRASFGCIQGNGGEAGGPQGRAHRRPLHPALGRPARCREGLHLLLPSGHDRGRHRAPEPT